MEIKSLDEYPYKNKDKGIRNKTCKSCMREYSKQHYRDNLDKYKQKSRLSRTRSIERSRKYIVDYLETNPCVDCGEQDIEVLEFDHIEAVGSRGIRVSHLYTASLDRIEEEINKCEVRCANCHVRRTRKQLGTSRYK